MGLWDRIRSGSKFCFKIGDVQEYIDYIKNNLNKIETIHEAPKNVQTAISNMRLHDINYRLNNFHSNVLRDYDKYTGLANNHNINVKKLYKKIAEFNQLYTDALNNPISFSINQINDYASCVTLVLSYKSYPIHFNSFLTQFNNLKYNYSEILKQFKLLPEARKYCYLNDFEYIDIYLANEIREKLSNLLKQISNKQFYEFPNINDLNQKIQQHNNDYLNSKREKILQKARNFDIIYKNTLDNPKEFNKCVLGAYKDDAYLASKYKAYNREILKFAEQFTTLNNDYENLLSQHTLYEESKKYRDFRKVGFIDDDLKKLSKENFAQIRNQVTGKHYYHFHDESELDKIITDHNNSFLNNKKEQIISKAKEFHTVYENALNNPKDFNNNILFEFENEAFLASKYSNNEADIKKFADEFNDLKNNIEQIILQYSLHKEAQKCCNFIEIGYIDEEKAKEIEVNLKNILKNISNKRYYVFPNENGLSNTIKIHNKTLVENGIKDSLFDDINGISLDEDQRRSIVVDEKVNLVVAGAGSGKTLTICGKLKYLTEKIGMSPSEILLLSFSNPSADDLDKKAKRINKEFEATTFHKKGLEILKTANNCTYVVETQFEKIIDDFFNEELITRQDLLEKVINYYGLYYYSNKNIKRYETEGELFEALKTKEYKTLKDKLVDVSSNTFEKRTLNRELVKSFEELSVANFYFLNGIEYVYEKTYEHDTSTPQKRQYQPDFYLPKYNIYHEHFGINEKGKATQFCGEEARLYEEGVQWKRNIHSQYQTKCIETYSYQFSNGSIFKTLEATLQQNGITLQPISKEALWDKMHGVINNADFESFKRLIMSFINLYKSRYTDESIFDEMRNNMLSSDYENQRIIHLLDICKEVYKYYKSKLYYVTVENNVKKQKIDFDDMILKSTQQLQTLNEFKYKYIIVDEFQDISFSRMQFLKSLMKHGNAKLFLVGDDWQSIYRFSGSDVDLFINIEKYLGKTNKSVIRSTHRNSAELIKITEPFIMANSEQLKKYVSSDKHTDGPVRIMKYKENKIGAFDQIIEIIYSDSPNASVLVLGRNKFDINSVLQSRGVYKANDGTLVFDKYKTLNIKYCTVHSSKGLEADYVVLINAEDSKVGFPNQIEDDDLLLLVLSNASEFPYAEERRLFYVALTRAKKICYILTCVDNPSVFIEEIEHACKIFKLNDVPSGEGKISCPRCSSGSLIVRENSKTRDKFYGCSNYPYCEYKNNDLVSVYKNQRCPECGDYLKIRTNKTTGNKFYGCNGFPHCNYKRNL